MAAPNSARASASSAHLRRDPEDDARGFAGSETGLLTPIVRTVATARGVRPASGHVGLSPNMGQQWTGPI